MFISSKMSNSLSQLPDSVRVIIDRLLQYLMFLHEVLCRDLILSSVFYHHVQFLLAHPGLGFVRVE